jgi:Ca2+-binding RTX toxin-like protein
VLSGGAGDDTFALIEGEWESDSVDGGSGTDTVALTQTSSTDVIWADIPRSDIEAFDFTEGGGRILLDDGGDDSFGGEASLALSGVSEVLGLGGDDVIKATSTAGLTFRGGAGNDEIVGGAGDDTLIGGAGLDSLAGGQGDDTYVLDAASGHEIITDSGGTADVLQIASGVSAGDVTVYGTGEWARVVIDDGTSVASATFAADSSGADFIETIAFADGDPAIDVATALSSGGGAVSLDTEVIEIQEGYTTNPLTAEDLKLDLAGNLGVSPTQILAGPDVASITHDTTAGELSLAEAPDFETPGDHDLDNAHEILVEVDNGGTTEVRAVDVQILNFDSTPSLSTPQTSYDVSKDTITVDTMTVNVQDLSEPATLSVEGVDGHVFTTTQVDDTSWRLDFVTPPDPTQPFDQDLDNTFEIELVAADDNGDSDRQAITVVGPQVDGEPFVEVASTDVTVPDDRTKVSDVNIVAEFEADPVTAVTLTGPDAGAFVFDEAAGELAFAQRPDVDIPQDSDGDNVYQVGVQAEDGTGDTFERLMSVTVTAGAATGGGSPGGGTGGFTGGGGTGGDTVSGGTAGEEPVEEEPADEDVMQVDAEGNMTGTSGGDTLRVDSRVRRVDAAEGDDTISVGRQDVGYREIFGGDGEDMLEALEGGTRFGMAGNFGPENGLETISANGAEDVEVLGESASTTLDFSQTKLDGVKINADAGNDRVIGNDDDNVIRGGRGADIIDGGGGNDVFEVDSTDRGFDTVRGGAGEDTIQASRGNTAIGLAGDFGPQNSVERISSNGNERVVANGSFGGNTLDFSQTELDGVTVNGRHGNDTLIGNEEGNRLRGGEGDDILSGGGGDDTFLVDRFDPGFDSFDGGDGFDAITAMRDDTDIGLKGDFGPDNGIEAIQTNGAENVTVEGDGRSNTLDFSQTETDGVTLDAGQGDDTVIGNAGDNVIRGGDGDDTLTGGSGRDTFVFERFDRGDDAISDFDPASDRLQVGRFMRLEDVEDNGPDLVVTLSNGVEVTLSGLAGTSADDIDVI